MKNQFTKAKVPVAVNPRHRFNVPANHVTTAGFMQYNVAYCRELVPGTNFKTNHKTFMRCDVMFQPTLGQVSINNRAFFVPWRTVWPAFTDFITNVPHNTSDGTTLLNSVPTLPNSVLVSALCYNEDFVNRKKIANIIESPSTVVDFTLNGLRFRFTSFGRWCYKLLTSLGYRPILSDSNVEVVSYDFSALPLLAVAKVYLDYYYPQAYGHYGLYASLNGMFSRDFGYQMDRDDVLNILNAIYCVSYDNDFFTSVWDSPTGPNSSVNAGGSVDFNINDVTMPSNNYINVVQAANGTPYVQQSSASRTITLSQYMDDSLKALTDYVKRHQLSSCLSLTRYLTEFGITLDADKLKRCYYLGSDTFPFQIGDVMSTAETNEASLGAYAGKGIAYSEGHEFSAEVDEFGMFVIINTIIPRSSYVQGIDKLTMRKYKLDYYTGEFDRVAVDAVTVGEVACPIDNVNFSQGVMSTIFGYAPKYYDYKIPYDRLTGDFICNSINQGLDAWYTSRMLNASRLISASELKHSLDFVLGSDSNQYNRIFATYRKDGEVTDSFKVVHFDDASFTAPMLPLYDNYEFDTGNGQQVEVEPNGVKMN